MSDIKRDENGRIMKGSGALNPGGRPKRERADAYYNILISILTDETWTAIVLKACEQARDGDRYARKWLSDYGIGTPEQRMLLAGAAGGELTVTYVNDWRKQEADE